MTASATAPASTKSAPAASPEAILLEALAHAGEALTDAIVYHDLDAIVAATRDAELLMARITAQEKARREAARRAVAEFAGLDADVDGEDDRAPDEEPGGISPDPAILLLGARIGATARRNALLLEHAWATDAALLRLLATAVRNEAEASSGTGYKHSAAQLPDGIPAGFIDRSA
jgi:hypothetical protein